MAEADFIIFPPARYVVMKQLISDVPRKSPAFERRTLQANDAGSRSSRLRPQARISRPLRIISEFEVASTELISDALC